jgi:two-component system CheB/CheR fusion protein
MDPATRQVLDSIRSHDFDFAVCVTDTQLEKPGPHILYVNTKFEQMTGYTAAEVVGKTPRIMQGPKTDRAVLARLKATLRTGGFFHGQAVNYRKDGSELLMAWSITPVGHAGPMQPAAYLAVQHDAGASLVPEMMSEVQRAHLAVLGRIDPDLQTVQLLRDQVEFANTIVDTLHAPLLVLDGEGRLRRANRHFYDLFKVAERDAVGQFLYKLDGGVWDIPALRHRLDEVLPQGQPVDGFEVDMAFPRVGRKVLHLNARQLPLTGPRNLLLLAMQDVTRERTSTEDQLDRANQFLAMLAHELRNPLAPILTAVEVLRQTPPGSPAFENGLQTVERQVRQSTRLIEDLLDVSRVSRNKITLRPERIDLRAVVEQAVETVRPAMDQAGHDFRVSQPGRPVVVDADPARLTQVLTNLLSNAAKYTPPGGTIKLDVDPEPGSKAVTVRVTDSGVGIAPEVLPNVFELFVQEDRSLSRSAGGLGIGLTLARRLAEAHGGTLTAASGGKDQGSTFRLTLPYDPAGTASVPPPAPPPAVTGRPLRVAVVDDNRDAADALALLLTAWGHTVKTAYDGTAGYELLKAFRPEVGILDIGLPGLNGFELAKKLGVEQTRPATLVAVTGYGHEADVVRAKWVGFDHHLVKPARPADVAAILQAASARSVGS